MRRDRGSELGRSSFRTVKGLPPSDWTLLFELLANRGLLFTAAPSFRLFQEGGPDEIKNVLTLISMLPVINELEGGRERQVNDVII